MHGDELFGIVCVENLDDAFEHDEAEVGRKCDIDDWLLCLKDAWVTFSWVGFRGHEDTDAVLEEEDFIAICYFEEGIALDDYDKKEWLPSRPIFFTAKFS